jgi:hypothetical protein
MIANLLRGGLRPPKKLVFEGGPMLGTKQEAVNFLNRLRGDDGAKPRLHRE